VDGAGQWSVCPVNRWGSLGTFPLYQLGKSVRGSITLTVICDLML
jgi:hypothetical protein